MVNDRVIGAAYNDHTKVVFLSQNLCLVKPEESGEIILFSIGWNQMEKIYEVSTYLHGDASKLFDCIYTYTKHLKNHEELVKANEFKEQVLEHRRRYLA